MDVHFRIRLVSDHMTKYGYWLLAFADLRMNTLTIKTRSSAIAERPRYRMR